MADMEAQMAFGFPERLARRGACPPDQIDVVSDARTADVRAADLDEAARRVLCAARAGVVVRQAYRQTPRGRGEGGSRGG